MVGRSIVWTRIALIVFDETLNYFIVRNGNDNYSQKLHKKVTKNTLRLSVNPYLGKEIENTVYRKLIFKDYSLIYKVLDAEIIICLFWDNRRNPEALEKELEKFI